MSSAQDVWKDFAGDCYPELVRTKEAALEYLFHPNSKVRIAAIHICDSVWNCSADPDFVAVCRQIAETDVDEDVRVHAISTLGKAFEASKDPSLSQFLARIVKSSENSEELRKEAYWALREVQFGWTLDDNEKKAVSLIKELARKRPMGMSEEQVKQSILGVGHFPKTDWNSVDQIDWDFVNQFV
jgi:HEAT repeat protein